MDFLHSNPSPISIAWMHTNHFWRQAKLEQHLLLPQHSADLTMEVPERALSISTLMVDVTPSGKLRTPSINAIWEDEISVRKRVITQSQL